MGLANEYPNNPHLLCVLYYEMFKCKIYILHNIVLFIIYRSGKIVCTGTRNEHDSYLAARKFARIIQKLGFPVSSYEYNYLIRIYVAKI